MITRETIRDRPRLLPFPRKAREYYRGKSWSVPSLLSRHKKMIISPGEFKKRWGEPLIQLNEGRIYQVPLSEKDRSFILNAGFPEAAAPFLSFNNFNKDLRRIYEIWGSPSDYSDEEKSRLKPYLVIGSDGAGSPIVIDTLNECQIAHLDHDDWFDTVTFINSSISQFAVFLLLTKEMILKAHSETKKEEFEQGIPQSYKKEVFDVMKKVDSKAMADGGFWKSEVGAL